MHTHIITVYNIHMTIRELLSENRIEIGAELYSKDEALDELILLQKQGGTIHNPRALKREIVERERKGNTAAGCRIAIPDVAHSGSAKTAISAITVKDGIDHGAPDKRKVKLLFMIAGKSGSDEHQRVKEQLLRLLSDPAFTAQLCAAPDQKAFLALIDRKENKQPRINPNTL